MPHSVRGLIRVLGAATSLFSGTLVILFPKKHNSLGDCAFSSADFNLWNNLPLHIRLEDNLEHFTSLLKMHLFRLAFEMQCFQPTSIVYFLALITMFTLAFFSFNIQSISCYTFTF